MKHALIQVGAKSVIVINLLIAFNFIYEYGLWETDLKHHAPFVLDLKAAADSADVLYLGDCSDVFFRPGDASFKPIATYLDEALPQQRVMNVSSDGFHAAAFAEIVQHIPDSTTISTVVVTVNLRSFAPRIRLHQNENDLNRKLAFLSSDSPLLNRFLEAFRGYDFRPKTEMESELEQLWHEPNDGMVLKGISAAELYDSVKTQLQNPGDTVLLKAQVADYATAVESEYLLSVLTKLAQEDRFRMIFLIVPEDLEILKQTAGHALVDALEERRQMVLNLLEHHKAEVLDAFDLLQHSEFVDELPNNHYSAAGREKVANSLREYLQKN